MGKSFPLMLFASLYDFIKFNFTNLKDFAGIFMNENAIKAYELEKRSLIRLINYF